MWGWLNAEEAGGESAAETAGTLLVGADRPQEVDLAEGGPVNVAEVELAVDALPRQEAAEAHLAGGPDYQVGVRAARRVQMALHCVRSEAVGQFRRADALGKELADGRPRRLDDLFPAAIADGHRDLQCGIVVREGARLRDRLAQPIGQEIGPADHVQPNRHLGPPLAALDGVERVRG